MTTFQRISFINELPAPSNHLTAQAVWTYQQDPYLYYKIYVDETCDPKQTFGNTLTFRELLLKQMLFCKDTEFDTSAPVNSSTDKPYGEDSKRYKEWAREARKNNTTPVHPEVFKDGKAIYDAIQEQIRKGFVTKIAGILDADDGQASAHTTANIDNTNCYAHVDWLSYHGITKLILLPNLEETGKNAWYDNQLKAALWHLAFQHKVFSQQTLVPDFVNLLVVENAPPHRIMLYEIKDIKPTVTHVTTIMATINASFGHPDGLLAWQSKFQKSTRLVLPVTSSPAV